MSTPAIGTPTLETSPAWGNYLDLQDDVKPYLQFSVLDSQRDMVLQATTDAACSWIQRYLGRPIAPTWFFRRFSGWSRFTGSIITLPYYPILQIQSVVEYWGANGPHTLTLQTPENQTGNDMYQVDALTGLLTRTFMGLIQRPWFPGNNNIEVTWQAGYNPVPAEVRLATLELIAYWWRNTQQASRSTIQPRGADYDTMTSNDLWPAVPNRITTWLQPFVQVGLG